MHSFGANWLSGFLWGFLVLVCVPMNAQEATPLPANDDAEVSSVSVIADEAATSDHESLTFAERLKIYERSFVSPEFWIGPPIGAAISQWADTPREWTRGPRGFGLRVASGYGRSSIGKTISFGIAALDHENTGYSPSHESGIWRRTLHAVTGTVLSRDDYGDTMPAYSRIVGTYGAAFIANAWAEKPGQHRTRVGARVNRASVECRVERASGVLAGYS
jgi:hypothetical protein